MEAAPLGLVAPDVRRPFTRAESIAMTGRFDRPTLVFDLQAVTRRYHELKRGLGQTRIHYAVKANPAPELIAHLVGLGSGFDAASRAEIALCLAQGARPDQVSFGNTIKKAADIAYAHAAGITLFAGDSDGELRKIAEHAPGAQVYIRLIVENCEADWALTRKFGCAPAMVPDLFTLACELGLDPVGVSFHVGSQTRRASMWAGVLANVADVWADLRTRGFAPTLVNIGGGFPAFYEDDIDRPAAYAADVRGQVKALFPGARTIMAEPGRGLVAEAGAIAAEVVLVSRKSSDDLHRWVYLDIGKFSGLAETMDEAIRYQFITPHDGMEAGPCVVAGPYCDSVDVLYEKRPVQMPLALRDGDRVVIRATGAYTTTYATVGFNGFPPLDVLILE